jgi:hypothetical protein
LSVADVIAVGVAALSAGIALFTFFYSSILTFRIESYVFTGKLFGEPKYGKDAIAQIVHLRNRSSKTLTDMVLKSKSVGQLIDSDVEENGFIGKSDVELVDDPDHAEWHLKVKILPPRASVSIAVLTNGLMRSHHLTGGSGEAVLMHEMEYRFRKVRRLLIATLIALVIGLVWIGYKWLN